MFRVAVTERRGINSLAIAADARRTINNVVLAIAIHVADGQTVRALAAIRGVGRIARERPAFGERVRAPVPRGQVGARVVAATKNGARTNAVAERDAREEAINAIAVAVAPDGIHRRSAGVVVARVRVAVRIPSGRRHFRAGQPVEHGDEFRPVQDVAIGHAAGMVETIIVRVVERGARAVGVLPFCRAADVVALAVNRAGRGAAHQLRFAVAVEIINHEIHVVRAAADVRAEVNAPEPRAIELVAVEISVAGKTALRVVVRVGGIPFQNNFVFTIAVHIAHAAIVRGFIERHAVPSDAAGRRRERDVQVLLRWRIGRQRPDGARGLRHAVEHGLNEPRVREREVGGVGVIATVGQVGGDEIRHAAGHAVEIEFGVRRIRAEQTPANVGGCGSRAHDDDAAPEFFQLALRQRGGEQRQKNGGEQQGFHGLQHKSFFHAAKIICAFVVGARLCEPQRLRISKSSWLIWNASALPAAAGHRPALRRQIQPPKISHCFRRSHPAQTSPNAAATNHGQSKGRCSTGCVPAGDDAALFVGGARMAMFGFVPP